MKIAVAYNGYNAGIRRYGAGSLAKDFARCPSTHTSETSLLLILDALREQGHEITLLVEPGRGRADTHFPIANVDGYSYSSKDSVLLVFLTQGIHFCAKHALMSRAWQRVVGWLDAPGCDNLLGPAFARFDAIAWATRETLADAEKKHPFIHSALAEYAMDFPSPPAIPETQPRGLYLGRLPEAYRVPLAVAAEAGPFLAHLLWADTDAGKELLRPGQIQTGWEGRLAGILPSSVEMHPSVNVVASAHEVGRAAFGFAPATGTPPQVASASKWWTYIALGLPVVTAQNVPEAYHVRENPDLGYLFDQGNPASIQGAVRSALVAASGNDFAMRRARIQSWGFGSHTYAHRARTIGSFLWGQQ